MLTQHHRRVPTTLLHAAAVAFAIASGPIASAQRTGIDYEITLRGQVLDELTGDPMPGAMVLVKRDGHAQDMIVTNTGGFYNVLLERGSEYQVTYTVKGCVAKRVEISTKHAPAKLDVPSITMTVDITLFPALVGLPVTVFEQPMGKAAYVAAARNIEWDAEYGKAMRNRIKAFMVKYDALQEKQQVLAGR